MREIFPTAEFYGHANILKNCAGISLKLPLPFAVQHGYRMMNSPADIQDLSGQLAADRLFWVWSEQDRIELCEILPDAAIEPFGAPFLYLLKQFGVHPIDVFKQRGSIVFPPHSTGAIVVDGKHGEICKFLASLSDEHQPIEVCMYYKDIQLGFHQIYIQNGFNVISLARSRTDEKFLLRFVDKVGSRKYAFVGDFSTAALYCAYLGLPVSEIPIKRKIISSKNIWRDRIGSAQLEHYAEAKKRIISRDFFGQPAIEQKIFAAKALGEDFVLSRNKVKKIILAEQKKIGYVRSCAALGLLNIKKKFRSFASRLPY